MPQVGDVPNVLVMEVDRFNPTPLYQQVAAVIRERIRSGELRPKDQVPSEQQMVSEHGIARDTARQAIALLRAEGWVFTVPQRGTYVSDPSAWPEDPQA